MKAQTADPKKFVAGWTFVALAVAVGVYSYVRDHQEGLWLAPFVALFGWGFARDAKEKKEALTQAIELAQKIQAGEVRYTDKNGYPKFQYLLPNDSRGRDAVTQYTSNDQVMISMWWLEGRTMTVHNGTVNKVFEIPGINPGAMTVDK